MCCAGATLHLQPKSWRWAMREAFWNGLFDVRWEEAPLGAEAIRLTVRLRERGYAERTCRDYGHAVVHLGGFLHEERGSDQVRDDEVVTDFPGGHLPGCRCYRRPAGRGEEPVRRGLAHLLVMLREEGNIPPVVADEPRYQELTEGYCRFLRRDRGLAETTVASYRRCLRDFLVSRGDAVSPAELVALSADDLLAFSRQRGAGLGRTAWNHLATALSGFCRWLDLCGHGGALALRDWASRHPCPIRSTTLHTLILLLATSGVRISEALHLTPSDVDLTAGSLPIHQSKSRKSLLVPVSAGTLDALRRYHDRRAAVAPPDPAGAFLAPGSDTEVYPRITTRLRQEANTRFHTFAEDLLPAAGDRS